ncbi:prepilin-type N-terminal cleavage/methylation domain-containing protein [Imhoffiella purpurea]|uniref:General secretion pathway protein J n=1 Tax=Imhoffiella purpurea TaxID=1249627 RepID=W9W3G6_9GAMM|nr:prepilin-type N-terminal cleavage/methylation domain-containing protein [Imhoffiella purpurea]EXJ17110.1 General secretion pathway protein J [Imhoffiella purpurea]
MRSIAVHRSPNQGFTLVELLIALAIIGLITLLLFSGLRLGSRAWEAVDAAALRTGDLRLAHGFLRTSLSQMRTLSTTFDGEQILLFNGDSRHIEFAAPLSDRVGIPGIYVLRLALEDDRERPSLVLTRWLFHPEVLAGGDDYPPWEPLERERGMSLAGFETDMDAGGGAFGRTLLLEQVKVLDIAYYGLADGDSEPQWHEEWMKQTQWPFVIRIRLWSQTQTWPDLFVDLPVRR